MLSYCYSQIANVYPTERGILTFIEIFSYKQISFFGRVRFEVFFDEEFFVQSFSTSFCGMPISTLLKLTEIQFSVYDACDTYIFKRN